MTVDRTTPQDASFLNIEDGINHMVMGSVAIFEGPPPAYDDVVNMFRAKLPLVPRYRQVVRTVPFGLGRPVWVDDPHFNIEYHIRHTSLPHPGSEAQLRRLVGRLMSQELDRTRPLWEGWITEGLEDGKWALVSKTHHSMVDGVGSVDILNVIMDSTPEPSVPLPAAWSPGPTPSSAELAAQALWDLARSPYEQFRALRSATRAPRQAARQLAEVIRGTTVLAGLIRPTAPSSLNGPIGPNRRYAWANGSVDDIKTVRKALGGTFNDVVLAVITRGLRDLLVSRGETVEGRVIRSLVPVSLRARDAQGKAIGDGDFHNKVSAMIAELPVGLTDPVERLSVISGQMAHLKDSKEAVAAEVLMSLTGFAPPMLLAAATRMATRIPQHNVNTVTTNVPGPQTPRYLAGRRMLQCYPYVPLGGQVRVGVAIFSYLNHLSFGVTGDYDTAPDIAILCSGIEDGMSELLKLSAPSAPATRRRSGSRDRGR
jgi:diacylglycerol O-acyltransferase / wax synthase